MPPKRKTSQKSAPQKRARKDSLVHEVVQEIGPLIDKAIKEAVAASTKASQPAEEEDEDLEVLFKTKQDESVAAGEPTSLHLHVTKPLMDRIKTDKYFNLYDLLNPAEQDISLNIASTGQVTFKQRAKITKITTGELWFSAFLIYSSAYQQFFPEKALQLFKYMSIVQNLNKSFGIEAAVKYDEDFRKMRENYPDINWDKINQELYLLSATKLASSKAPRSQQPFRKQPFCPAGYCRQFHTQGICTWTNCKYKHECFKCKGEHSVKTCGSIDPFKQPNKSVTSSATK